MVEIDFVDVEQNKLGFYQNLGENENKQKLKFNLGLTLKRLLTHSPRIRNERIIFLLANHRTKNKRDF